MSRFLKVSAAVATVAAATGVYGLVTGEYPNLAARRETEAVLNLVVVGGVVYAVIAAYTSVLLKPVVRLCRQAAE